MHRSEIIERIVTRLSSICNIASLSWGLSSKTKPLHLTWIRRESDYETEADCAAWRVRVGFRTLRTSSDRYRPHRWFRSGHLGGRRTGSGHHGAKRADRP